MPVNRAEPGRLLEDFHDLLVADGFFLKKFVFVHIDGGSPRGGSQRKTSVLGAEGGRLMGSPWLGMGGGRMSLGGQCGFEDSSNRYLFPTPER